MKAKAPHLTTSFRHAVVRPAQGHESGYAATQNWSNDNSMTAPTGVHT